MTPTTPRDPQSVPAAENLLARWIGLELLRAMAASGSPITGRLRVEVDECLGQSAVWERLPN
jgi:hypothetical protein